VAFEATITEHPDAPIAEVIDLDLEGAVSEEPEPVADVSEPGFRVGS